MRVLSYWRLVYILPLYYPVLWYHHVKARMMARAYLKELQRIVDEYEKENEGKQEIPRDLEYIFRDLNEDSEPFTVQQACIGARIGGKRCR